MTDTPEPVALKPCPFCDCPSVWIEPDERGSGGRWVPPVHVGCSDCGCQISDGENETSEQASEAWNKRATRPDADLVRQLVEAVEPFAKQWDEREYLAEAHWSLFKDAAKALQAARAAGYGGDHG